MTDRQSEAYWRGYFSRHNELVKQASMLRRVWARRNSPAANRAGNQATGALGAAGAIWGLYKILHDQDRKRASKAYRDDMVASARAVRRSRLTSPDELEAANYTITNKPSADVAGARRAMEDLTLQHGPESLQGVFGKDRSVNPANDFYYHNVGQYGDSYRVTPEGEALLRDALSRADSVGLRQRLANYGYTNELGQVELPKVVADMNKYVGPQGAASIPFGVRGFKVRSPWTSVAEPTWQGIRDFW